MWSDNETSEDLLGFKVHADLIIDVIKDDTILPVTVGIFGDWGSGKSSVLKIIKENLEKLEDGTFVLYFNGWVFEGYDDAKAALLESIIKAFDDNKKLSAKVKDKTSKLLKSVKWMRLLGLGFKNIVLPGAAAYLSGGATLIPFLAGELSKQTSNPEELIKKLKEGASEDFLKSLIKDQPEVDESMLVREFRNDFSEMIRKSEIKKLVVIIDDLDRCTPDRIIENLEAIKLFLNVEKTAFLIGADPRIVRHAIEHRFKPKADDTNDRIVDDYLEKLIQIPYYLPKLSDSEVETYISLLICKRELVPESFTSVIEKFCKYRESDRYSVYGLSNIKEATDAEKHTLLTQSISAVAPLVPLIASSLYGNPRQIKRFLNTFTLRKRLADVAKIKNFNDAILAKLMILEYSELPLFRQIYEWQLVHDGVPEQIKMLENLVKDKPLEESKSAIDSGEQKLWAKEKVVKWLQSDPTLQGIDLRDYYWISRDKISSSIPGASLVSPIIRAIFTQLEEELPATASKKIIQEKIRTLSDDERFAFLEFSAKMLKKNPKKKRYFDIFNYMIDENVTDAPKYYQDALQNISVADIEAAVGTTLRNYKSHPTLGGFLKKYFEKNIAPAAKAFNL